MSKVFFDELRIPRPHIQLNVGSGSHGGQTARMLEGIEEALLQHRPDVVVIYGDTNSTLAGAVAASKLHIPVAHIEAGLRSFNKAMPEEINRIVSDHCSTWLFCPTTTAVGNLEKEGFPVSTGQAAHIDRPKVMLSGDVMFDNSRHFARSASERSTILKELNVPVEGYFLATIHRPANTDDPHRLAQICEALMEAAREYELYVVLPLHPRTRARMEGAMHQRLVADPRIHLIDPVGFLDMTALEMNARLVLTDSGGVQKEAYFFGRPCVILRAETEWVELVDHGMAALADADKENILARTRHFLTASGQVVEGIFGDGRAAEHICAELVASHTP